MAIDSITAEGDDVSARVITGSHPDLQKLVHQIEQDRKDVDEKHRRWAMWHRMRTVGIGRASLPFRGASDFHYPLVDTYIDNLKPFYYQQAISPDPLCSFIPSGMDKTDRAVMASHWFDWQVRDRSNIHRELLICFDYMLERGKGIMKLGWDFDNKRLRFEAIDPSFLIVPPWTSTLGSADRIAQVIHISIPKYRRLAGYHKWERDEEFIKEISGYDEKENQLRREKQWIEGIAFSAEREVIVLYEIYSINDEGLWCCDLVSPKRPDKPVRKTIIGLPYCGEAPPYVEFNYEVRDGAYYSSRGVCDLIGQWELLCCKYINELNDCMTFVNRPVFTSKGATLNAQNFRFDPGQVFYGELDPIQMPQPPISFMEQIQHANGIAGRRISLPNPGLGDQGQQGPEKTATQARTEFAVQSQPMDLRGRISKMSLTDIYNKAWKILLYYNKDSYDQYYRDEYRPVDGEALQDVYVIKSNANSDGYNKDQIQQRLLALLNNPAINPFLNKENAARLALELDDPRWIKELWVAGGVDQGQVEEQYMEIAIMMNGTPVAVKIKDEDLVHMNSMDQFEMFRRQQNAPIALIPVLLFCEHYEEHTVALREKNPQVWKQMKPRLDARLKELGQRKKEIMQLLAQGAPGMIAPQPPGQGMPNQPIPGAPPGPGGGVAQPPSAPSGPVESNTPPASAGNPAIAQGGQQPSIP